MAVPVWIARGQRPGKTLAVTAGIHGDELNGIEVARRVFVETDPKQLSGTLVVLPVLNRHGFLAGSRYMSDRRDLNRAFPGSAVVVRPASSPTRCSRRLFNERMRWWISIPPPITGLTCRRFGPTLAAQERLTSLAILASASC